jgi:LysM repeat protein
MNGSYRRWWRSAGAVPVLLLVVSCGLLEDESAPTATPDEVFTIVTATVQPSPTMRNEAVTYIVQEGDTLTSIAAAFDVTQLAIINANDLDDPDDIQAGQQLVIPPPINPDSGD